MPSFQNNLDKFFSLIKNDIKTKKNAKSTSQITEMICNIYNIPIKTETGLYTREFKNKKGLINKYLSALYQNKIIKKDTVPTPKPIDMNIYWIDD